MVIFPTAFHRTYPRSIIRWEKAANAFTHQQLIIFVRCIIKPRKFCSQGKFHSFILHQIWDNSTTVSTCGDFLFLHLKRYHIFIGSSVNNRFLISSSHLCTALIFPCSSSHNKLFSFHFISMLQKALIIAPK